MAILEGGTGTEICGVGFLQTRVSKNGGTPIAGWCIVVNPITMDDLGGTPIEEGNYFQINVMINSHGREPSISHFPINQTQLSSSDQNPLFMSIEYNGGFYWIV